MTIPELCVWRFLESRKHWPTSPCNEADWIAPIREIQISPCFQHDFHDVKLVASNMDPLFFFQNHSSTNLFCFGFKSSPPISPRLGASHAKKNKSDLPYFTKPHPWESVARDQGRYGVQAMSHVSRHRWGPREMLNGDIYGENFETNKHMEI